MEVDNETVDEDLGDVVLNPKDIQMLERFHLGREDEDTEPSDSVAHLDNFDSDDETYDPNFDSDLDTCAAANASLKGEWIAAAANTPVIV
jgi:hypothetical protein